MVIIIYLSTFDSTGEENYENIRDFGQPIFEEMKDISANGIVFQGVHHEIDVVSSCDWKAEAIIEGMCKDVLQYL